MADVTGYNADTPVGLTGLNTSGVPTTPVASDSNGNLLVKDYADGVVGSTAPTNAHQIAGKNPSGNLQPLLTDTNGYLYVDVANNAPPNNLLSTGTLTGTGQTVNLTLQGTASVNVDVSGSGFVGTIVVIENTPSQARVLGVFNTNASPIAASITTNGNYRVVGLSTSSTLTVQFSAYTSGSATINIYGSTAPFVVMPYSANAANVLVTSYLADGSGNTISSQSNAINVNTKTPRVYLTPQTATVNTTSTLILVANSNRKGLYLSNTGNQQISLGFDGQTPSYQYGITLYPGDKFWMDEYSYSVGAIYAITTGSTTYIGIQEIT